MPEGLFWLFFGWFWPVFGQFSLIGGVGVSFGRAPLAFVRGTAVAAGRPSRTNGAAYGATASPSAADVVGQRGVRPETRSIMEILRSTRKYGTGEPRRGMRPFLRTGPLLPARNDSTQDDAPRKARRNDRPPASYYDDTGLLTYATHCCSDSAAGLPHTAICNRRCDGASSCPGGDDDSPVAAPRGSAPPARKNAGGAAPDTPSVHNASPRAAPHGTSRTHTIQTTV